MKEFINIKNGALMLGVTFLILGAVNSTLRNVTGGVSCFAAGVIVIILFHFDVKSFNVFGLAAELRGKISEADDILRKLRDISLPISEIAITTISQAGRYDSVVPKRKLYEFVTSISDELKSMQVSIDEVERVRDSWYLATSIDMAIPIHREIQNKINHHRQLALKKNDERNRGNIILTEEEAKELDKQIGDIEYDHWRYYEEDASYINPNYKSYPSYFVNIINNLKGVPAQDKAEILVNITEHVLDLEYLINHKDIRRPEVWFDKS